MTFFGSANLGVISRSQWFIDFEELDSRQVPRGCNIQTWKLKDSKNDVEAGDLLYRLPGVEEHRKVKPASHRSSEQETPHQQPRRVAVAFGSRLEVER
jgi:hypothetical protein